MGYNNGPLKSARAMRDAIEYLIRVAATSKLGMVAAKLAVVRAELTLAIAREEAGEPSLTADDIIKQPTVN